MGGGVGGVVVMVAKKEGGRWQLGSLSLVVVVVVSWQIDG
jgi:hypothetical protein